MQDVIDGDLCEQFPTLPMDMQRKIADELDRTPGEILKKLEEIRNKIIWEHVETKVDSRLYIYSFCMSIIFDILGITIVSK